MKVIARSTIAIAVTGLLFGCVQTRMSLQELSARHMGCPAYQIQVLDSKTGFPGNKTWRARCGNHVYQCQQITANGPPITTCHETPESQEAAMRRVAQGSSGAANGRPAKISAEEGNRVLKGAAPEARLCSKGLAGPLKIDLQINGDGSTIYLGAEPEPPVDASACIRKLFGTVRFRATGAPPFTVTYTLNPPPPSEEPPSPPPEPTANPIE